ncbi:dynamin family protein [Roseobacter sp.]|uniref:dynamin family protein n=1 Tax=Roseobacter sp. TaxID=1907202 RepID=UPI0032977D10
MPQKDQTQISQASPTCLLGDGLEPLQTVASSIAALRQALGAVATGPTAKRADRLLRQLDGFEPSVTLIGQIKSGKTSVVNALAGTTGLLPADVNPWTSVVTSLHLHPEAETVPNTARFQFFDQDEWDSLISGGGRIGELARRAGADDELDKIKSQAADIQEKSRHRLGCKFEILLGQRHDYEYIDEDLIQRYVCLGEDLDANDPEGASATETLGRFADITKSADLTMSRAALPVRLCLRDTPGVNDTFMVREQITIRAIRDSRLCVVVLSANQALSSTDMALIRLITHMKSRDVIIFVNRVDELSDPATQIPQIQHSIFETLAKHNGPEDADVIFGSALWASHALDGRLADLPPNSAQVLDDWAQVAPNIPAPNSTDPAHQAWALSGVPALQHAIATRIVDGPAASVLGRIGRSALNLVQADIARQDLFTKGGDRTPSTPLDTGAARARLDEAVTAQREVLKSHFDAILTEFGARMDRVQASFLDRATASLIAHLETYGDEVAWSYDPAGLRMLLSSSHKVLVRKSKAAFDGSVAAVSHDLAQLYLQAFDLASDQLSIAKPVAPQVASPVGLGRTIALDLSSSWWNRWWKNRRGYKAYTSNFYDMIKAETDPFVHELRDDLAAEIKDAALDVFEGFVAEQASVFAVLEDMAKADPDAARAHFAEVAAPDRQVELARAMQALEPYVS